MTLQEHILDTRDKFADADATINKYVDQYNEMLTRLEEIDEVRDGLEGAREADRLREDLDRLEAIIEKAKKRREDMLSEYSDIEPLVKEIVSQQRAVAREKVEKIWELATEFRRQVMEIEALNLAAHRSVLTQLDGLREFCTYALFARYQSLVPREILSPYLERSGVNAYLVEKLLLAKASNLSPADFKTIEGEG